MLPTLRATHRRRRRTVGRRRVWIILPAFNEAENLPPLLDGIAAIRPLRRACSIVVVNDGSRDGTAAVASGYGSRLQLRVLSHARNRGLARTIETGIRAALRDARADDVIVTMDADNTHTPILIPRLLRRIEEGADVVIASRYARGGREQGVPVMRRFLSHAIGCLLRLRFGLRGVRDYTSGYRAYRADVLRAAAARYGDRFIEADGFHVMAEILVKLRIFSPRIVEVPLDLRYDRKHGQSKFRLVPTVAGYLRLLARPAPRAA
jgi:dolichol-phosphate mannosyltransferase